MNTSAKKQRQLNTKVVRSMQYETRQPCDDMDAIENVICASERASETRKTETAR